MGMNRQGFSIMEHFVASIEMKFSVEKEWMQKVRAAKRKPEYGMSNMDGLLEEVVCNKLKLTGPPNWLLFKRDGQYDADEAEPLQSDRVNESLNPFNPLACVSPHVRFDTRIIRRST